MQAVIESIVMAMVNAKIASVAPRDGRAALVLIFAAERIGSIRARIIPLQFPSVRLVAGSH
jgi:hypothetical protein